MAITDWPLQERPREKLLRFGAASLSEAELLAIFLQTGVKGKTALDLARELLSQHRSLRGLLNISENQINAIAGMGKAKFSMLQAALEIGKRLLEEDLPKNAGLTSAVDAKKYLVAKLAAHKRETFACIFLSSRHHIIKYEELFQGTINCAPIYPRIIAQKALDYNAAALILSHNHPSGDPKPSQSDIKATQDLIAVLAQLDIRVLDHIIVAGNRSLSFTEAGLI